MVDILDFPRPMSHAPATPSLEHARAVANAIEKAHSFTLPTLNEVRALVFELQDAREAMKLAAQRTHAFVTEWARTEQQLRALAEGR